MSVEKAHVEEHPPTLDDQIAASLDALYPGVEKGGKPNPGTGKDKRLAENTKKDMGDVACSTYEPVCKNCGMSEADHA